MRGFTFPTHLSYSSSGFRFYISDSFHCSSFSLRHWSRSSPVRALESLFISLLLHVPGAPRHDYCISPSGVLSTFTCSKFTTWSDVLNYWIMFERDIKSIWFTCIIKSIPWRIYDRLLFTIGRNVYIFVLFALSTGSLDSTYELNWWLISSAAPGDVTVRYISNSAYNFDHLVTHVRCLSFVVSFAPW